MGYTFAPQDGASESQAFWTLMGQALASNGVFYGMLNQLAVTVVSGLQIQGDTGQAWVQGFFFQSDAAVTPTLSASDPSNPRIDRLVVHCDLSAHTADIRVLTGTPAGSPSAPALTQSSTIWEISLAKIAVGAGVTSVSSGNITDERTYVRAVGRTGSGSGLDADTLDAHDTSYFLASSAYTAADVLTKIKTVDGSGSGLDADTVDGLDSTALAPIVSSSYHAAGSGTGTVHLVDFTIPGDGVYRISTTFRVSTAGDISLFANYTDTLGVSGRTNYVLANQNGGTTFNEMNSQHIPTTGPFEGLPMVIECKSGTTLSIRTQNTGGGGSDTFSIVIEQLI